MRVLFDENVPRKLRLHLTGHSITTVQQMSWGSYKNGELLKLANGKFDVFLTIDKNIRYQNNFTGLDISVLTILVLFNKLQYLVPVVPQIMKCLDEIKPGQVVNFQPV